MNSPPDFVIRTAVEEARRSPCAKSKRGVALYRRGIDAYTQRSSSVVVGRGHNRPPSGLPCHGNDACRAVCSRYCVHAEVRAILDAHFSLGSNFRLSAVHVKVVDGELVAGGPPSCLPCATVVLEAGIERFWLYEDQPDGARWVQYSATDFYNTTVTNVGLWK